MKRWVINLVAVFTIVLGGIGLGSDATAQNAFDGCEEWDTQETENFICTVCVEGEDEGQIGECTPKPE